MPTHAEKRYLPYAPADLYGLVADIEKYPEFLPWCLALRVRNRDGDTLSSDMVIGFKMFRESFTTQVTLNPTHRIDVEYLNGPFRYLNNHWIFEDGENGGCVIDFYVDFEFRSALLQKVIGVVFNEAVTKMINAFEARADKVLGDKRVS